jgi:6-phosphofructokinase
VVFFSKVKEIRCPHKTPNMDRALCTVFGTHAVELIADGDFGQMVAYTGTKVSNVPITTATGRLRTVPLNSGFVRSARALGICLGD